VIQFLLDTNICVELIRAKSLEVQRRFRRHPVETIALSSITLAELQFGVVQSQQPTRAAAALMKFLTPIVIVNFDHVAATAYGELRSSLESAGTPIGPLDTLIAAQALAHDLTLVTNNEREFRRAPGLRIENWIKAS
jgi:tRNA(fMet)-specific endonuclease VapC